MILVVGSKGMLGAELCLKLEELEMKYVGYDYDVMDITKLEDCRKYITNDINVVINCAAYTAVDLAEDESNKAFSINAIGARNLAMASKEVGAKLVQVSTDYVFDGFNQTSYSEYDIANPISVYGKTKFAGEEFVRVHNPNHFILRTAWLFGIHGNNFIKTMISLKDREILKVVNDQHGSPTSCTDLIEIIIKLIGTEKYGTYHTTSEGETTWYEFAKFIFDSLGYEVNIQPCTTEEFPTKAVRPKYSVLNSKMLEIEEIGLMPCWKDSVLSYLNKCNSLYGKYEN